MSKIEWQHSLAKTPISCEYSSSSISSSKNSYMKYEYTCNVSKHEFLNLLNKV